MRWVSVSAITMGLAASAWTQHAGTYNPVRPMPAPANALPYGNILFPGGINSNNSRFPSQLGGNVSGSIPYTGVPAGYRPGPGQGGGGGRNRTMVVPYAVPVYGGGFYGGYGYDYGAGQGQAPTNVTVVVPQQPAPSLVINQTFTSPEGTRQELREYSATETPESGGLRVYEPNRRSEPVQPGPARAEKPVRSEPEPAKTYAREDKPTIYLIALKDTTVRQAIGYWVEGSTLNYVTPQASVNHVSLDMVDRDMSAQLNSERKLEFDLKIK